MGGTALVIGAAGYLGTHVCSRLVREGYHVKGLIRPGDMMDPALRGVQVYRGSVASPEDVGRAAEGAAAIVNCAVIMPDRHNKIPWNVYRETNVEGGKIILDIAGKLRMDRVIFISTAGVLEVNPGDRTADDESPLRAGYNDYLKSKIEFEQWLSTTDGSIFPNWILLRPSSIFGPGLSFKWPQVIELMKSGNMKVVGDGSALHPHVHVLDLADAIFKALTRPIENIRQQRVTITSSEEIRVRDVMRILSEYYGVSLPRPVPAPLAMIAAYGVSVVPRAWRSERLQLLTPGNIREYTLDRRYDTSKARRVLGFESKVTFREGMIEMLNFSESRRSSGEGRA